MSQYFQSEQDIARRQALAQALQQQSNISPQRIGMTAAGGYVVPISPWEQANSLMSKLLGTYSQFSADKQASALNDQKDTDAKKQLQSAIDSIAPTPSTSAVQMDNTLNVTNPVTGAQEQQAAAPVTLQGNNSNRDMLSAAVNGMDPQQAAPMLQRIALAQATPAPITPYQQAGLEQQKADMQMKRDAAAGQDKFRDAQLLNMQADNVRADKQLAETSRFHDAELAAKGKQDAAPLLSPDTIHNAAIDVMQDPNLMNGYVGRTKDGNNDRRAIQEEKTNIMKNSGLTEGDILQLRQRGKAEAHSVGQLTDMLNAVQSYEGVAKFNGDRVKELVNKVDTTGVPLFEGPIRWGKKALGNDDAAELAQTLQNFSTEAARIIGNPKLTGQLTEGMRTELKEVVSGSASASQMSRIINRLNAEMEFRGSALGHQIETAQKNYLVAPNQGDPNRQGMYLIDPKQSGNGGNSADPYAGFSIVK